MLANYVNYRQYLLVKKCFKKYNFQKLKQKINKNYLKSE